MAQGPATIGEKELRTDWPHEEGNTAETTKTHGRDLQLRPTIASKVLSRRKALL